jgi:hypothetical protein
VRLFLNGKAATSLMILHALEAKTLQGPQISAPWKYKKPPRWWLLYFRSPGWRRFYFQSSENEEVVCHKSAWCSRNGTAVLTGTPYQQFLIVIVEVTYQFLDASIARSWRRRTANGRSLNWVDSAARMAPVESDALRDSRLRDRAPVRNDGR